MGKLPGLVCLVSSRNFPGQFTDQKEAEAKRQVRDSGKTKIYVFDKRGWEVKPPGSFSASCSRQVSCPGFIPCLPLMIRPSFPCSTPWPGKSIPTPISTGGRR